MNESTISEEPEIISLEDGEDGALTYSLEQIDFTEEYNYTITVNGIPRMTVTTEDEARDSMWDIIRLLHFSNPEWRIHNVSLSKNELRLIGSYRFWLLSYDRELYKVRYDKVPSLKID